MNYKIWDKQQSIITPSGKVLQPEEMAIEYGFSSYNPCVLGQNGEVTYSVDDLEVLKEIYKVSEADPEAALAAVIEKMAEQKAASEEAAQEPGADERIAAALEYQNLLSL